MHSSMCMQMKTFAKKRFMERGKSESEFRVRSDSEDKQFADYEDEHGYDIIIFNNGNIEDTVDIIESYVKLIIKRQA